MSRLSGLSRLRGSAVRSRALLLIGLGWFTLAAPTPGAVGSCGRDDLSERAEFGDYCQRREELVCTRRFLRKEITAEARDICRWDAIDACERRSFPRDCRPTRRETDACLRALASFDTLQTPDSEIAECRRDALCHATPSDEAAAERDQDDQGSQDGGTP